MAAGGYAKGSSQMSKDDKAAGDSFTHKLAHPFKIRDKSYAELTVRRPLVRDLITADRQPGQVASSAALVAVCAGIPIADFGYMDAGDFRTVLAVGEGLGFFPLSQPAVESDETSSS